MIRVLSLGWLCVAGAVFAVSPLAPRVQAAEAPDACVACHSSPAFRVQNPPLFDYFNEWTGSSHALAGVSCAGCHGGNAAAAADDKAGAHQGMVAPSDVSSPVYYKALPATCGNCHEGVFSQFISSNHFLKLQQDTEAPHCGTCHGSVNSRVRFSTIVDGTCQSCHQRDDLPKVADRARDALQQLKVAKAYLQWTSLYYASQGQPERASELKARYQAVAEAWHRFDLDTTQQAADSLLKDLESEFREVWKAQHPDKPLP